MSGGAFTLAIIGLGVGFTLLLIWASEERWADEQRIRSNRRLLAELSRHPSSDGTWKCPYCGLHVKRCDCE